MSFAKSDNTVVRAYNFPKEFDILIEEARLRFAKTEGKVLNKTQFIMELVRRAAASVPPAA